MTLANFGWRLTKLKKDQEKQAQSQLDNSWYSFIARPTCPPSTSISIHGGTCIESKSMWNLSNVDRHSGLAWTVPNMVKDLTDPTEARVDMGFVSEGVYTELIWTAAGYYRGGILLLLLPDEESDPDISDWRLRLHCYEEEYATPGGAEARLIAWFWDELDPSIDWDAFYWPDPIRGTFPYEYQETGMPLCGIILRNDGALGTGRYFMDIDVLDRGRSYTWPRDMRPQWVNK